MAPHHRSVGTLLSLKPITYSTRDKVSCNLFSCCDIEARCKDGHLADAVDSIHYSVQMLDIYSELQ